MQIVVAVGCYGSGGGGSRVFLRIKVSTVKKKIEKKNIPGARDTYVSRALCLLVVVMAVGYNEVVVVPF